MFSWFSSSRPSPITRGDDTDTEQQYLLPTNRSTSAPLQLPPTATTHSHHHSLHHEQPISPSLLSLTPSDAASPIIYSLEQQYSDWSLNTFSLHNPTKSLSNHANPHIYPSTQPQNTYGSTSDTTRSAYVLNKSSFFGEDHALFGDDDYTLSSQSSQVDLLPDNHLTSEDSTVTFLPDINIHLSSQTHSNQTQSTTHNSNDGDILDQYIDMNGLLDEQETLAIDGINKNAQDTSDPHDTSAETHSGVENPYHPALLTSSLYQRGKSTIKSSHYIPFPFIHDNIIDYTHLLYNSMELDGVLYPHLSSRSLTQKSTDKLVAPIDTMISKLPPHMHRNFHYALPHKIPDKQQLTPINKALLSLFMLNMFSVSTMISAVVLFFLFVYYNINHYMYHHYFKFLGDALHHSHNVTLLPADLALQIHAKMIVLQYYNIFYCFFFILALFLGILISTMVQHTINRISTLKFTNLIALMQMFIISVVFVVHIFQFSEQDDLITTRVDQSFIHGIVNYIFPVVTSPNPLALFSASDAPINPIIASQLTALIQDESIGYITTFFTFLAHHIVSLLFVVIFGISLGVNLYTMHLYVFECLTHLIIVNILPLITIVILTVVTLIVQAVYSTFIFDISNAAENNVVVIIENLFFTICGIFAIVAALYVIQLFIFNSYCSIESPFWLLLAHYKILSKKSNGDVNTDGTYITERLGTIVENDEVHQNTSRLLALYTSIKNKLRKLKKLKQRYMNYQQNKTEQRILNHFIALYNLDKHKLKSQLFELSRSTCGEARLIPLAPVEEDSESLRQAKLAKRSRGRKVKEIYEYDSVAKQLIKTIEVEQNNLSEPQNEDGDALLLELHSILAWEDLAHNNGYMNLDDRYGGQFGGQDPENIIDRYIHARSSPLPSLGGSVDDICVEELNPPQRTTPADLLGQINITINETMDKYDTLHNLADKNVKVQEPTVPIIENQIEQNGQYVQMTYQNKRKYLKTMLYTHILALKETHASQSNLKSSKSTKKQTFLSQQEKLSLLSLIYYHNNSQHVSHDAALLSLLAYNSQKVIDLYSHGYIAHTLHWFEGLNNLFQSYFTQLSRHIHGAHVGSLQDEWTAQNNERDWLHTARLRTNPHFIPSQACGGDIFGSLPFKQITPPKNLPPSQPTPQSIQNHNINSKNNTPDNFNLFYSPSQTHKSSANDDFFQISNKLRQSAQNKVIPPYKLMQQDSLLSREYSIDQEFGFNQPNITTPPHHHNHPHNHNNFTSPASHRSCGSNNGHSTPTIISTPQNTNLYVHMLSPIESTSPSSLGSIPPTPQQQLAVSPHTLNSTGNNPPNIIDPSNLSQDTKFSFEINPGKYDPPGHSSHKVAIEQINGDMINTNYQLLKSITRLQPQHPPQSNNAISTDSERTYINNIFNNASKYIYPVVIALAYLRYIYPILVLLVGFLLNFFIFFFLPYEHALNHNIIRKYYELSGSNDSIVETIDLINQTAHKTLATGNDHLQHHKDIATTQYWYGVVILAMIVSSCVISYVLYYCNYTKPNDHITHYQANKLKIQCFDDEEHTSPFQESPRNCNESFPPPRRASIQTTRNTVPSTKPQSIYRQSSIGHDDSMDLFDPAIDLPPEDVIPELSRHGSHNDGDKDLLQHLDSYGLYSSDQPYRNKTLGEKSTNNRHNLHHNGDKDSDLFSVVGSDDSTIKTPGESKKKPLHLSSAQENCEANYLSGTQQYSSPFLSKAAITSTITTSSRVVTHNTHDTTQTPSKRLQNHFQPIRDQFAHSSHHLDIDNVEHGDYNMLLIPQLSSTASIPTLSHSSTVSSHNSHTSHVTQPPRNVPPDVQISSYQLESRHDSPSNKPYKLSPTSPSYYFRHQYITILALVMLFASTMLFYVTYTTSQHHNTHLAIIRAVNEENVPVLRGKQKRKKADVIDVDNPVVIDSNSTSTNIPGSFDAVHDVNVMDAISIAMDNIQHLHNEQLERVQNLTETTTPAGEITSSQDFPAGLSSYSPQVLSSQQSTRRESHKKEVTSTPTNATRANIIFNVLYNYPAHLIATLLQSTTLLITVLLSTSFLGVNTIGLSVILRDKRTQIPPYVMMIVFPVLLCTAGIIVAGLFLLTLPPPLPILSSLLTSNGDPPGHSMEALTSMLDDVSLISATTISYHLCKMYIISGIYFISALTIIAHRKIVH